MFNRLLVPTDLTDATSRALSVAVDVASERAHIDVLHVIERIPNLPDFELRLFYERLQHDGQTRLEALVKGLHLRTGQTIESHLLVGRRADEIVRFSQAAASDLVILHHRPDGALLGSISYRVSVLAPCSVLLLK